MRLGELVALDPSANFFGLESRGRGQIRGNGCLGASPHELFFVMWWPRREVLIDRRSIVAVERTRWHLGKSVGRELLKVSFTDEAGRTDSVAWLVADLAAWEAVLTP
jgi:hypothetical protein